MKLAPVLLLMAAAAAAQTSSTPKAAKPGDDAPPLTAKPLDAARAFTGWSAFRGNYVIVDFWATWCGPCIPGLDRVAAMEKEFAGRPVRFMSVALDEFDRVKKYFAEKGINLQTFVDGEDSPLAHAFGVHGIPATAVIDREGKLLGVTSGENVTSATVTSLLNGNAVKLPPPERMDNILWDRDEITWQDGVQPIFQAIIKPLEVSGGGSAYRPGSNRISGDGAIVQAMIQSAWRTDAMHVDIRATLPTSTYRFAILVPKGREAELFPTFQDAVSRTFGIQAHWEDPERDAFALTRDPAAPLKESTAEALFQFLRGKITMRKQPISELARALPNWMRKPVVDETGLSGFYDFDLEYRDDGPKVLLESLARYGLSLTPARRKIRTLVVERKDP